MLILHFSQSDCYLIFFQIRRYGSGCYRYLCDKDEGKLKIILRSNVTLTCFEEGQKLDVSLKQDKWLHEGSIICPKCSEICGNDVCNDSGSLEEIAEANKKLNDDIKEECDQLNDNSIREFLNSFQFDV